ncbi:MAG TPA: hypothetical protein VH083_04620 [Myxococcales bacterium]|jgi:hypothetical protein|nr:hypothetical protein [Myxococcales bacterium]
MNIRELNLTTPQGFEVFGAAFTAAEARHIGEDNALRLTLPSGEARIFPHAVDDSQSILYSRVHVLTGSKSNQALVFGGERALRLSGRGVEEEIATNRSCDMSEYFATEFFACADGTLIVYESGVFLIDESLVIRWHVLKYINDIVQQVSGKAINFLRDHEEEWSISLPDGLPSIPASELPKSTV